MDTYTIIRGMAQVWCMHQKLDGLTAAELFLAIQDVIHQINECDLFFGIKLDKDGRLQLTLDLYECYRELT